MYSLSPVMPSKLPQPFSQQVTKAKDGDLSRSPRGFKSRIDFVALGERAKRCTQESGRNIACGSRENYIIFRLVNQNRNSG
jgi:hypothetical protein